MYVSLCAGRACPRGRQPEGLLWNVVDALLVSIGMETAGDFVEFMTGGFGAAADDAAWDATADLAAHALAALAVSIGVGAAPLGAHGGQVLAVLLKFAAAHGADFAAAMLGAVVLARWEPAGRRLLVKGCAAGDDERRAGEQGEQQRAVEAEHEPVEARGGGGVGAEPAEVFRAVVNAAV